MSLKPTAGQLERLTGNPLAYALQTSDGSWFPVEEPNWTDPEGILSAHLDKAHTVGTYVLWGDKARTLVFDLDEGEGDLEKAEGLVDELARLGVPRRSVGIEYSGRKGYHVWVVLADYTQAKDLRRLGRIVLGLAGISCEVFPKQDEAKKLGNLVKLPGGIHQVSKKENNFIDRVPQPMSMQVWKRILGALPPEPEPPKRNGNGDDSGLLPCVQQVAEGVEDGNRNNALYHYAVLLRGSHRVPDEAVDALVRQAAEKCDPPYDGPELEALIESSRQGGPLCDQLGTPCEGRCVRNKMRPVQAGELKRASAGSTVTVVVKKREGGKVRLTHPDIKAGGMVTTDG